MDKRYRFPFFRHFKAKSELGLQVGLFKAWKDGASTVGHQQNIKIFVVAVERLVAGNEADMDFVFTLLASRLR